MVTTTRPASARRRPSTAPSGDLAAQDRELFVRAATERLLQRYAGLMTRLSEA